MTKDRRKPEGFREHQDWFLAGTKRGWEVLAEIKKWIKEHQWWNDSMKLFLVDSDEMLQKIQALSGGSQKVQVVTNETDKAKSEGKK